jgi:branched-chain amino acid transport system permease protein
VLKRYAAGAAILLFLGLYPVTFGATSPYHCAIMIVLGIYVILAVSLDLLTGFAGQISLGHAAFYAIGAYASGILTATYQMSPMVAMAVGACLTGSIAAILGWSVLALKGYYLAMATMGLTAITHTVIIGWQSVTGGASGLRDVPPFSVFGLALDSYAHYYYVVWIIAVLVIACCLAIVRSPMGRTLMALHSDEAAASTLGINCAFHKTCTFVTSAVFASLAGSLYAHYMGFLAPDDFSIFTSVHILIMVFLGGVGTIYGAALGAIFLKLLPELTHTFQDYELLGNGIILILVLVFMPQGLWGLLSMAGRKAMRLSGRTPRTGASQ